MWVTIATQNYKGVETSRAFLKEGNTKQRNFEKEMKGLGWKIQSFEVDSVMVETLSLEFSVDRK